MAIFTVTTLNDNNDGETLGGPYTNGLSLREAILLANSNVGTDTINFAAGGLITLGGT